MHYQTVVYLICAVLIMAVLKYLYSSTSNASVRDRKDVLVGKCFSSQH